MRRTKLTPGFAWLLALTLAGFLGLEKAQALPAADCDRSTRDFLPLTRDLEKEKELSECRETRNARNSRRDNGKSICASVFGEIHSSLEQYKKSRSTGCLEIGKIMNSAASCNLKEASSQLKCLELAAEGFRMAAGLEAQSGRILEEAIQKFEELETEAGRAIQRYQDDNKAMALAFRNLDRERGHVRDEKARELNRLGETAVAVENFRLRSRISGSPKLTARNGGEETIRRYSRKVPALIREESRSRDFAREFQKLAKEARTRVALRAGEWKKASEMRRDIGSSEMAPPTPSSISGGVALPFPVSESPSEISASGRYPAAQTGAAARKVAGARLARPGYSGGTEKPGGSDDPAEGEGKRPEISGGGLAWLRELGRRDGVLDAGDELPEQAVLSGSSSSRAPSGKKFAKISVAGAGGNLEPQREGPWPGGVADFSDTANSDAKEEPAEDGEIEQEADDGSSLSLLDPDLSLFLRVTRVLTRAEKDGMVSALP